MSNTKQFLSAAKPMKVLFVCKLLCLINSVFRTIDLLHINVTEFAHSSFCCKTGLLFAAVDPQAKLSRFPALLTNDGQNGSMAGI